MVTADFKYSCSLVSLQVACVYLNWTCRVATVLTETGFGGNNCATQFCGDQTSPTIKAWGSGMVSGLDGQTSL